MYLLQTETEAKIDNKLTGISTQIHMTAMVFLFLLVVIAWGFSVSIDKIEARLDDMEHRLHLIRDEQLTPRKFTHTVNFDK